MPRGRAAYRGGAVAAALAVTAGACHHDAVKTTSAQASASASVFVPAAPPSASTARAPAPPPSGSTARGPVPADARRLCAIDAPVDRITYRLECLPSWNPGQKPKHFDEESTRESGAWVEERKSGHRPFSDYENKLIDRLLAEGLARICRGERDPNVRYLSLHRREFGWPLDACHGHRFVILRKGRDKLELRQPLVEQIAKVEALVHLHELGRRMVEPDAGK